MDFLQILLLALIQGITEFLPISSSAHLILPAQIFGFNDQGLAFDVAVHIGSLAAVVIYFRQDINQLCYHWLQSLKGQHSHEASLAWSVIYATLPAIIAGLIINNFEHYLRSSLIIATSTIVFGLLLAYADKKNGKTTLALLTHKQALFIGLMQCLALIPGTSRSGITITAALLMGFDRQSAARFSFLLSIPLILAAGSLKTLQLSQQADAVDWQALALAAIISAISAYLCIRFFLQLIDKIGFMPFVIYRLILGVILLYFVW